MTVPLSDVKDDLERLIQQAATMHRDLALRQAVTRPRLRDKHKDEANKLFGSFEAQYHSWYTEAHAVIRQLIPDRLEEFAELYKAQRTRKTVDILSFSIQDWLNGLRASPDPHTGEKPFDDHMIVYTRFKNQKGILEAARRRFDGRLFDIRRIVQADLFDSELDAARELLKRGFLRGAGAVSGVVLEKHLAEVAETHSLKTRKSKPTINDWNELLKSNEIIDIPTWRYIQRLGDLRNLCDHNKDREPTAQDVEELIGGVEKITKTVM